RIVLAGHALPAHRAGHRHVVAGLRPGRGRHAALQQGAPSRLCGAVAILPTPGTPRGDALAPHLLEIGGELAGDLCPLRRRDDWLRPRLEPVELLDHAAPGVFRRGLVIAGAKTEAIERK